MNAYDGDSEALVQSVRFDSISTGADDSSDALANHSESSSFSSAAGAGCASTEPAIQAGASSCAGSLACGSTGAGVLSRNCAKKSDSGGADDSATSGFAVGFIPASQSGISSSSLFACDASPANRSGGSFFWTLGLAASTSASCAADSLPCCRTSFNHCGRIGSSSPVFFFTGFSPRCTAVSGLRDVWQN